MNRLLPPVVLLTAALLSACGGDDPGGKQARGAAAQSDFCTAYVEQVRVMATLQKDDLQSGIEASRAWAASMRDVELPGDLSKQARRGLDTMMEELSNLGADTTWKEIQALGDELPKAALRDIKAMGDYVQTACAQQVDEVMSGLVDDLQGLQDQLDGAGS